MSGSRVALSVLGETYAVARLDPDSAVPKWAAAGELSSVTRTPDELSIVCAAASVPAAIEAERDWRCLRVAGPLDFSEVGILASLTGALSGAGISLFAVSTYDTDYILVRARELGGAIDALRAAGHPVTE